MVQEADDREAAGLPAAGALRELLEKRRVDFPAVERRVFEEAAHFVHGERATNPPTVGGEVLTPQPDERIMNRPPRLHEPATEGAETFADVIGM